MFKAMGFIDSWGPDMRLLHVCRARTRHCPRRGAIFCGLAYPGKLWWQGRNIDTRTGPQYIRDHSKWGFFSHVGWQMLRDEKSHFLDDPELKRWVDNMANKFGSDILRWPDVGCGTKFVPHAKGPSMVAEIRMAHGE